MCTPSIHTTLEKHTQTQTHKYIHVQENPNIFETVPRQEVVRVLGNIFNKQASEKHMVENVSYKLKGNNQACSAALNRGLK